MMRVGRSLKGAAEKVVHAQRVAAPTDESPSGRKKLQGYLECADPESAAAHLIEFLEKACGSVLRAWILVFDNNNDQRISKIEFGGGMRELGYVGEPLKIFKILDDDGSNELTLGEMDEKADRIWKEIRGFCTEYFLSAEDFIQKMQYDEQLHGEHAKHSRLHPIEYRKEIFEEQFMSGMLRTGWTHGEEDLRYVWEAICEQEERKLTAQSPGLVWMSVEIRRVSRKLVARNKSSQWLALKARQNTSPLEIGRKFDKFKAFLKKKRGSLIRAWRQDLTMGSDTMTIPKVKFLKAAAKLGFAKEGKELWKGLDKDDSGSASVDELDLRGAEGMAIFKVWAMRKFKSVKATFRALDEDDTKIITYPEFVKALDRFEFPELATVKTLFNNLDKDGNGKLEAEDLAFLEKWEPLAFLLCEPDEEAKDSFKRCLVNKMNVMKAWRHMMDKDGSNRCNWHEFLECANNLGFKGNTAGAWRAFDNDLSGYITLKELDEEASEVLTNFRMWAIQQFGSVRSLFTCFDEDGSNSLTFQEFRGACRVYGYPGHTRALFNALDVDHEGTLSMREVDFLDEWDLDTEAHAEETSPTANRSSLTTARRSFLELKRGSTLDLEKPRLSLLEKLELEKPAQQVQEEPAPVQKKEIDPSRRATRWKTEHPMQLLEYIAPWAPRPASSRGFARSARGLGAQQQKETGNLTARSFGASDAKLDITAGYVPGSESFKLQSRAMLGGWLAEAIGSKFDEDTRTSDVAFPGDLPETRSPPFQLMETEHTAQVAASKALPKLPQESTMRPSSRIEEASRHYSSRPTSRSQRLQEHEASRHYSSRPTSRSQRLQEHEACHSAQMLMPTLDDLFGCPRVGPVMLTSSGLRSRGKSGSCGAVRNIRIS